MTGICPRPAIWVSMLSNTPEASELALPGVIIVASHIIVCMVAGNNHQRTENHFFFVAGFLNLFRSLLRMQYLQVPLYSADEYIVISEGIHLVLHLAVTDFCGMRGSVSHEYESSSVLPLQRQGFRSLQFLLPLM